MLSEVMLQELQRSTLWKMRLQKQYHCTVGQVMQQRLAGGRLKTRKNNAVQSYTPWCDIPTPLLLKLQALPDVELLRRLDECECAGVRDVLRYLETAFRNEDLGKTETNSESKVLTAPGESDVVDLEPTSPVASDDMQPVPYSSPMDNGGVRSKESVSPARDRRQDFASQHITDSIDWNSRVSAVSSDEETGGQLEPPTDHESLAFVAAGKQKDDPLGLRDAVPDVDDPLGLVALCSVFLPKRSRVHLQPCNSRRSRTPLRRRYRTGSGATSSGACADIQFSVE